MQARRLHTELCIFSINVLHKQQEEPAISLHTQREQWSGVEEGVPGRRWVGCGGGVHRFHLTIVSQSTLEKEKHKIFSI